MASSDGSLVFDPDSALLNICVSYLPQRDVDVARLLRAVSVAMRHQLLRTLYTDSGGDPHPVDPCDSAPGWTEPDPLRARGPCPALRLEWLAQRQFSAAPST